MNEIHVHTHLDSDTLHLPELSVFIGKDVEITVREKTTRLPMRIKRSTRSAAEREKYLKQMEAIDIDEEAINKLRQVSMI